MKKYISVFALALSTLVCFGQFGIHQLVNSASGIYNGPALTNGMANISWSVGEVVVFNQQTSPVFIAQSMQSYTTSPVVIQCPEITLNPSTTTICDNFGTVSIGYSVVLNGQPYTVVPDSIQWYFSETGGAQKSNYFKIAGASAVSYAPLFPGYYAVELKYDGLNCKVFSPNVLISNFTSAVIPPTISGTGSPTNVLTASPDTKMGTPTSLQWYVYVPTPSVNKYLLIAGGASATQNVRYDGNYMVMATYANGCRLSNVYTVSGYNMPIQRATDVRMDPNTIYIPEEGAYSEAILKIYPNPASGYFYVHFQSSEEITTKAGLYSNAGVLLRDIEFTEGGAWARSARVSTQDLSAGVYFLKVNQESKHLVEKVMIYK